MARVSSTIDTQTEILSLQVPDGIGRLSDLVTMLMSVSELYSICWKLTAGLDVILSPPMHFSPAASPFPPTAPDLRVEHIEQGSLIVHLTTDLSSGAGLGLDAAGASSALWLLYRLLRRGPRTIAQFIAEVLSTRTLIETRRAQLRRELAQAQQEEATKLREVSDARVAQWLAQDNENQIWLRYQALASSAPDLQVKMIDEEGRDLHDPSLSE